MSAYILDAAGFVTGTFDGPGAPAGSTSVPPPANAIQPLRFVDGAWLAEAVAPTSWDDVPPEYWHIDIGPFFDRFGQKALTITSSEDNVVKGLLTLILPRKYIDLKRADMPQMLGILVSKGLITAAEKQAVLTNPTTEYERHYKGLPQPTA